MFVEQMQAKLDFCLSTDDEYDRNKRPVKSFVFSYITGDIVHYFVQLFKQKINFLYFHTLFIGVFHSFSITSLIKPRFLGHSFSYTFCPFVF